MKLQIIMAALMAAPMAAFAYPEYQPPSYFHSSGAAPVVIPPTVINTQAVNPNETKKSCKESMIDLFLISFRRTTGDCTP